MKVNDIVTVKTDGAERREGTVLAVEPFLEGTMYLVALSDYPAGIWFFNEEENPEGIFVELKQEGRHSSNAGLTGGPTRLLSD